MFRPEALDCGWQDEQVRTVHCTACGQHTTFLYVLFIFIFINILPNPDHEFWLELIYSLNGNVSQLFYGLCFNFRVAQNNYN